MPQIIATDPGSTEVQSPLIAGISEGLSKISNILNLQVGELEDYELENVVISDTDKNRIYQAVSGHRLWLSYPAPVFKKNGDIISPAFDGFTVDYVGGSITFIGNMTLQDDDVVTVSCSYITANSKTLYDMQTAIEGTAQHADKYKGAFNTLDELETNVDYPKNGDFAIILSIPAFYAWKDTEWKNTQSIEDLSNYYTIAQVNNIIDGTEPTIPKKTGDDANDYYYSGNKTWLNIREKVRDTVLTGLSTITNVAITATDSVLIALGKLQAQITAIASKTALTGTSDPTTATFGNIGQRYINTSNGKWWTLKDIAEDNYIWVEGAYTASKLTNSQSFSIADNDGSNVGPAASFDGSKNVIINLSSTIKANLDGNASTATYATSAGASVDQTARDTAGAAMPKAGGTFTGNVVAYATNRAGSNLRNIVVADSAGNWTVSTNQIVCVRK